MKKVIKKIKSKYTAKVHLIVFGVLFLMGVLLSLQPDEIIKEVMLNLSEEHYYSIVHDRTYKANFKKSGKLNSFHECLNKYRGSSSRKITTKRKKEINREGIGESLKIRVRKYSYYPGKPFNIFYFRTYYNEVYSFSVKRYDSQGKLVGSSDLYAINCELSLLGK